MDMTYFHQRRRLAVKHFVFLFFTVATP